MTTPSAASHTPQSSTQGRVARTWSAPGDALACVAELRDALGELGAGEAGSLIAQSISDSLEQIVEEHRGMAEELISVYEQLGIIFEVTRRLPAVQGEEEVSGLFLQCLRRSFGGCAVFLARVQEASRWVRVDPEEGPAAVPLPAGLGAVLQRVCTGRPARAAVERLPRGVLGGGGGVAEGEGSEEMAEVLIGPVVSGERVECALVIVGTGGEAHGTDAGKGFRISDVRLVESLATFCGDLIHSHRLAREMREMSIAMVRSLVSAVDQKDRYTCGHSLRVGYYATTLGRLLNLREVDLQMLQWSALLHDVGKIGIRDDVLNKEGKLTPEEFQHIKEHPGRSHHVVQQVPQLKGALDGILHHHERFDGSGYPAGLKGRQIPLQARIIQIADVFDALTSSRSYRPAYDWRKALDILKDEAGKTVDPELQKIFDQSMRQRLSGSEQAWAQMLERANHFAEGLGGSDEPGAGAEEPMGGRGGR